MKKEGITFYAKISSHGQILIPSEIRRFHNIQGGEVVKVLITFKGETQ